MFAITVMVDDKKVAGVLWALDGLIVGEPTIRPVRGAKAVNGQVKSTQKEHGLPLYVQAANRICEMGLQQIPVQQFKDIVVSLGGKPQSAATMRSMLTAQGFLSKPAKGRGKNQTYRVLRNPY